MTVKSVNAAPGTSEDMPTAFRDLAQNDQGLDTRLTAVEGTLSPLPGNITAETNRALAAEQAITGNLTAETTRAKAAEALLAPLASPALTGTPTAPTATAGDNSTKIANTAFVQLAVAGGGVQAVLYGGGQTLSLSQQSTARGNIAAAASGNNTDISSLAGPALGAATAATAPPGTNTAQVANTAFVTANFAPLASPALTGAPTAPTPTAGDSSTKLATTAYVQNTLGAYNTSVSLAYAPLASPALTGTPTAPTAAAGTSTTQIATTAFAQALPFLSYGALQTLTDTQLTQARSNLFVPDISAMAGHSLLVNGFHNVSQQFGTTAFGGAGSGGYYTTDQWVVTQNGSMGTSGQQVANPFPSQPDIPNGLKLSITTAEAPLAAGDYVMLSHPLEGTNLARLNYGSANAKPVTLAWMIRPSIAITGYVRLATQNSSAATIRAYLARFTAPANTDAFVYLTIPGDVAQSLLTTNVFSLGVQWCFGAGTTYQGTAGVWSGNNVLAGSDVTNLAATVGNSVILSGAVMFPGVIPISQSMLPLLARRYDDELRLCQRYFNTGSFVFGGYGSSVAGNETTLKWPQQMRSTPTLTYNAGTFANCSTYDLRNATADMCRIYTVPTSATAGGWAFEGTYTANARM